eukprot:45901_1
MAYFYTGANPVSGSGYYVTDNAQLWLHGGDPTKCTCGGDDSDCVKVIIGETEGCTNVRKMNFVSLDGISYLNTPPPQNQPESGSITLATIVVDQPPRPKTQVGVWVNAKDPGYGETPINPALFVYDGYSVTLSGLIEYRDTFDETK